MVLSYEGPPRLALDHIEWPFAVPGGSVIWNSQTRTYIRTRGFSFLLPPWHLILDREKVATYDVVDPILFVHGELARKFGREISSRQWLLLYQGPPPRSLRQRLYDILKFQGSRGERAWDMSGSTTRASRRS